MKYFTISRIDEFKKLAISVQSRNEQYFKIKIKTAFELIEELEQALIAEYELRRNQIKVFVSNRKKRRCLFYFIGDGESWEGAAFTNREKAKLYIRSMQSFR